MKIWNDDTVELNDNDLMVLRKIEKYCHQHNLDTTGLEKVDLENIADEAKTKKKHVKLIIDNIEID